MSKETVERARELSEYVSTHGWKSLDIDRTDPATVKAVLAAAIDVLYARSKGRR